MEQPGATAVVPVIPTGPEYENARSFFRDLGFDELWEDDGFAGFRNGDALLILQRCPADWYSGNYLVQLHVSDLDAWWQAVSSKNLEHTYPGLRVKAPTDYPWGREVHLAYPPGIGWRVREAWG